jgi:two-component system, LytTR family, sensor kinase
MFQMGKSNTKQDIRISLLLHAIAWILVIIIPLYLNNVLSGGNMHRLYEFYLHTFTGAIIFYVGYLWLVPGFFLREKRVTYLIILAGLILATHFFTNFVQDYLLYNPAEDAKFQQAMKIFSGNNQNFKPPLKLYGFLNHVFISVLISGFALGLGVMEKLKQNEKKQKEMEKEKLHSELAFLKNQVSPHFFFNTLNNIYSLIGIDGPTAQNSVLKLSKMMRYLLYESERGETMMSHEIDFMNNYIDLMKLRQSKRVDLQVDFPTEFTDFSIPPLLFIPFIENAFKHGVNHREDSVIKIRMELDKEQICFFTENRIGKSPQTGEMQQHSGIGLDNVRKRLGLLFPNNHELNINKDEATFKVALLIKKGKTGA